MSCGHNGKTFLKEEPAVRVLVKRASPSFERLEHVNQTASRSAAMIDGPCNGDIPRAASRRHSSRAGGVWHYVDDEKRLRTKWTVSKLRT